MDPFLTAVLPPPGIITVKKENVMSLRMKEYSEVVIKILYFRVQWRNARQANTNDAIHKTRRLLGRRVGGAKGRGVTKCGVRAAPTSEQSRRRPGPPRKRVGERPLQAHDPAAHPPPT